MTRPDGLMNIQKIYIPQIGSTNAFACRHIQSLHDRTVVYADLQTEGKGRYARTWVSEKGNLFLSLILKPSYDFAQSRTLGALTHYTALVLVRTLRDKYGIKAKIKWPNDILVGDKKIAGILTETIIQGENLQGIIIGIGVNLHLKEKALEEIGQPAASLQGILKKEIDRDRLMDVLLEAFFSQYEALLEKGFALIRDEYVQNSMFLGKEVRATVLDQYYCGIAKDIDDSGALVLDCGDVQKTIRIGDISCS